MLLLLQEFQKREGEIAQIYLSSTLRVEKLRMDFELAIHLAYQDLFKIRGCYFHFSQAIWRRVQACPGLTSTYVSNMSFQIFVRQLVALPFLPMTELEDALEELKLYRFEQTSPSLLHKLELFRDETCAYFASQWLYGDFPPRLWTCWGRSSDLTNNRLVQYFL